MILQLSTERSEQTGRSGRTGGYRPELPGLRALASALVVIYHVWLGRVSGGVDVFFVVSGFLLAGQMVRAAENGGIVLRRVWARMLKRLLPASVTVLLTVIGLSVLFLPENRWFQAIREVVASVLFLENWQLARDSADYFAQHDNASVVQHFWSLSVQGQFFVAFPLSVVLLGFAVRRFRLSWRAAIAALLGVVFVASFLYSVVLTEINQPLAYFSLFTRLWEFAFGGLLALVIHLIVLPRAVRILLGWAGVIGLVACGLVLKVGTVFPGYAALWPALCAAAVLCAGMTGSRVGADRILASRPLAYLGGLSFALYLWHWPLLVLYLVTRDEAEPGLLGGALVIGVSLVLSMLTYHLIETPVRQARSAPLQADRTVYRLAAAAVVVVLVAAGSWQVVGARQAASYALAFDDPDHPGARAMEPGFEYWGAEDPPLVPPLVSLAGDWARPDGFACEMSPRGAGLEICRARPEAPGRRVALVGDSHPGQFLAALRPVAEERNWELIVMSRGACPFSSESEVVPDDQSCLDWNAAVMDELLADRPDFVVTAASRDVRIGRTEHTPPGFVNQWWRLHEADIPVLAVRDNPRHPRPPSECVRLRGRDAPECAVPRAELYAPTPPYAQLDEVPPNVQFLDFTDYYCDQEVCPPVIGNILVYMDDNHLSATYLASMAPIVGREIDNALNRFNGQSG